MSFINHLNKIIDVISALDGVLSIGKSGGEALPERDGVDIDLFIFCDEVPILAARNAAFANVDAPISIINFSEKPGRFWGVCDFAVLDTVDLCLMYFTIESMDEEIVSVLDGRRIDKEDGYFYPTGRCATFLTMHALCDKAAYIAKMKDKLSNYPDGLSKKIISYHIKKIYDDEDFQRAAIRRDVLFYHSVLETALDHYLQALFALNKCYFPGRKRSIQYVNLFEIKPLNCAERLLNVIGLGSKSDTISQSCVEWASLCRDLSCVINNGS